MTRLVLLMWGNIMGLVLPLCRFYDVRVSRSPLLVDLLGGRPNRPLRFTELLGEGLGRLLRLANLFGGRLGRPLRLAELLDGKLGRPLHLVDLLGGRLDRSPRLTELLGRGKGFMSLLRIPRSWLPGSVRGKKLVWSIIHALIRVGLNNPGVWLR
jgi:hypothetical protein